MRKKTVMTPANSAPRERLSSGRTFDFGTGTSGNSGPWVFRSTSAFTPCERTHNLYVKRVGGQNASGAPTSHLRVQCRVKGQSHCGQHEHNEPPTRLGEHEIQHESR